jgi:FkbM family methyltransferase
MTPEVHSILTRYLQEHEIKKFIQIGVNDGVQSDWFREFILANNWYGLMVEPHADYMRQAQSSYERWANYNRLTWVEAAITNLPEKTKTLYHVAHYVTEKWLHTKGIASLDIDHLLIQEGCPEDRIRSVEVPCMSMTEMLDQYDFWDADLVIMDVEGHERQVVDSCDWNKFRPKILILETAHMTREDFYGIIQASNMESYNYEYTLPDSIIWK